MSNNMQATAQPLLAPRSTPARTDMAELDSQRHFRCQKAPSRAWPTRCCCHHDK